MMDHGIRKAIWAILAVTILLLTQQSVFHSCRLLQEQAEQTSPGLLLLSTLQEDRFTSTLSNEIQKDSTIDSDCTWENDLGLVHVVYSRFMQHQPNLMDLGRARLILFRTFAAATMSQQTTQHFLWIIQVDPELHPVLLHGLIEALHVMPRKNVLVIGSTKVLKGSHDGGFRGNETMPHIIESPLFYGSLDLAKSYHEAAQSRVVLESTLDADDGLNVNYMEHVQQQTVQRYADNLTSGFLGMVWCVPHGIEWHYYSKWDNTTYAGSFLQASTHICLTPGLTWVTHPAVETGFVQGHHKIMKRMPECRTSSSTVNGGILMGCYQKLSMPRKSPAAIRARTPTSAGMNSVQAPSNKEKKVVESYKEFWNLLGPEFGISVQSIIRARRQIQERISFLLEDALKGMCTPDHSCGDGIKDRIMKIKNKEGNSSHHTVATG